MVPRRRTDRDYLPAAGRTGFGFAAAAELHAHLGISRAEVPTLDLGVGDPPGTTVQIPTTVVPALHATLVETPAVRRHVEEVLGRAALPPSSGWSLAFRALQDVASAAEAPSLPLGTVPACTQRGVGAPAQGSCATLAGSARGR